MEKYGFKTKSGGLTTYDGVLNSGKEIDNVVIDRSDPSSPSVTWTFEDGATYVLTASVSESSGVYTITDITETWTPASSNST